MEESIKKCSKEGCENEARKNQSDCKAHHNEYMSEWRKRNPEKSAQYIRNWQQKNPDKVKAARQRHYLKNKDAYRERAKQWREANPEKVSEAHRRWREANEGHTYLDTATGYVIYVGYNHPACSASGISRHHRLILWDKLQGQDANCNWCGKRVFWKSSDYHSRLVTDHVNTVKDDNRPENLVPSCQVCNVSREGGQNRLRVSQVAGLTCELDFCDRDAYTRHKDSGMAVCKAHYQQAYLGRDFSPIKDYRRPDLITDTHKHCTGCDEVKPHADFYIRNGKPKGVCKKCEIKRTQKRTRERLARAASCSADECSKPALTKGMCSAHYAKHWQDNRKEITREDSNS